MSVLSERNISIDVGKGILILLVVVGHSGFSFSRYIFWFHMPAFFFITGLLSNDLNKKQLKEKIINYGVLYLSYFILVISVSLIHNNIADLNIYNIFLKLFIGGRFIGNELGVFWYLSCLMFSILIFHLIHTYISEKRNQIILLISIYLLAHFESFLIYSKGIFLYIPLNLDVSLLAVCYISIGFFSKKVILYILNNGKYNVVVFIISSILVITLLFLDYTGLIYYHLDMKLVAYNNIIGDIFIPILFTILILSLSKILSQIIFFSYLRWLGYYSVVIMFLHLSIKEFTPFNNWILSSLIGLSISLFLAVIFDKFKITNFLFISGKIK